MPSRIEEIIGAGFTDDAATSHAPAGRYYTDPDLHQLELDRVFAREWFYVGHQSQVANTGDYLVCDIGPDSVYVIRDGDGEVRAFHNVCRHRGHRLLEGHGTIKNLVVCPYHAWSYGHDGGLRGAPKMRLVPDFRTDGISLTSVRVETVAGFVFVNMDDDAAPLTEMAPRFEQIVRSMVADPERLQLVKSRHYDIAANWKIVTENFLEAYHVEFSGPAHRGLVNIIDPDSYEFDLDGRTIEYTAKGGASEVLPYKANTTDAFSDAAGPPFHQVFLYPHMTFSVFPGTNTMFVFTMAPGGVDRCAESIHYLTLDAEMSEASQSAETFISETLNGEDVRLVEAVQRGVRSRGYRPGRLMVDAEQRAGWGEQFVHHFNRTNLAALQRTD